MFSNNRLNFSGNNFVAIDLMTDNPDDYSVNGCGDDNDSIPTGGSLLDFSSILSLTNKLNDDDFFQQSRKPVFHC